MLNIQKIEIHELFHSKKLGLIEIGNKFEITAREALVIVQEVDKKKAAYDKEKNSRFGMKKRLGGKWVFKNKDFKPSQKKSKFEYADTALSIALKNAGL